VVIKFGVKTIPDRKWAVKRQLLRCIKNAFDDQGIEIPFPHRIVIHRAETEGPADPTGGGPTDQTSSKRTD
jgi:small conductance mechanosensitive channel